MKRGLVCLILAGSLSAPAFAKGPEVDLVDNKLSINAESVSLGRLLRLVDLATGMKSKVPAELANRNISVTFAGLNVTDGVRKIFQGQPLDYVVIEGQGVIVTAASQSSSGSEPLPSSFNPQPPQLEQPFVQDFSQQIPGQQIPGQPFQPGQPGQPNQQPQQPAMIQTPFGPIANPRAQQQQQNAPLSTPGQQNSLFQQPVQPNQQNTLPFQGAQPTGPFATQNPFGTQAPPSTNQNSLFGNLPTQR